MRIEWPTLGLIGFCYGLWGVALAVLPPIFLPAAVLLATLTIALHASLQHEALHGHPFENNALSAALVFVSLNLCIPFIRFRDQHLAHHLDSNLTDPYDDPESNYLDPAIWRGLTKPVQLILIANNTLLGRLILGPFVALWIFWSDDLRRMRGGDRVILRVWLGHAVLTTAVVYLIVLSPMPIWAYCLSCYFAMGILKIRTYLEHQAHERATGRTVIIEDRGLLAFLFLNNNFHVVHHQHPKVPWYELPEKYFANREMYLKRNGGYLYKSYAQIFRRHMFRAKDPVPHPLWPGN